MRNLILLILVTTLFFSCEKTIILDTEQVESKLVVSAHLTDELKLQTVTLSRSVDFYYDQRPPAVTSADVIVTDLNTQEVYPFVQRPDEPGVYVSESGFEGKVGHTYELEIIWNGEIYTAREEMKPITAIDSLGSRVNLREQADPEKEEYFYEALLFATEPQDTEDYYFFKFYRNDSLIYAGENEIYFTDDKFLGEKINALPAPIFYKQGDMARVEMFSITRNAYIYLNDLFNILNNDSGMFSPPPANPRNNISNGALGYFMVSSVTKGTIKID